MYVRESQMTHSILRTLVMSPEIVLAANLFCSVLQMYLMYCAFSYVNVHRYQSNLYIQLVALVTCVYKHVYNSILPKSHNRPLN